MQKRTLQNSGLGVSARSSAAANHVSDGWRGRRCRRLLIDRGIEVTASRRGSTR
jgi:hypothetical protein